ncbi:MAG: HDIG domain-containing protein [Acidobacteria bacterium]|jgi:putative nucleotidyltransferase with HDIG domain|nr:HDIG domain-containing protein [Acidobacteriota bacterium]
MNRSEALALVKKNLKGENLVKHSLAVEACMREFAARFGEDVEKWGLSGLLHDLDYDSTVDDPPNHALKTVEMLREYNLDEDILHAIKGHDHKAELKSRMDIALYVSDPTSGFITACALMHPSKKLENVDLKRMKKRFKESAFAKGANREQMQECVKMGIELDDFLQTCLSAMQKISESLGL